MLLHEAAVYCLNKAVFVIRRLYSKFVHCLILAENSSSIFVSHFMSHTNRKHFPADKYVFLKVL